MDKNTHVIAFTGGGTAGHVFPAFPVINRVRRAGYNVFWIGSAKGMERDLTEKAGIRFCSVPAGKFRRYFSFKNLADLFRIATGFFVSLKILRRERPEVLFSKGGFVSVPPAAAARVLKIPVLTHESDTDPGLATRLNLKLGAVPLVSFSDTLNYLPPSVRPRAVVTGNPVRDEIFSGEREKGRKLAGTEEPLPLILVLGGSQGAKEINNLIAGCLKSLLKIAYVVHQTGKDHPLSTETDSHNIDSADIKRYMSRPFFTDEMPHLLAAADLAVCRSGAGSVWELAASGTPSVLIPLREGSRGDQLRNARAAREAGMAVVAEKEITAKELRTLIGRLLEDQKSLNAMSQAAQDFSVRDSADRIASCLTEVRR